MVSSEVHGLVHPVIPSGRPGALFPAKPGEEVLRPQLYTTTSWGGSVWLCQLGRVPGTLCPWMGPETPPPVWNGDPDLGSRVPCGCLPVWCGVGWGEVKTLWVSLIYIYARECSRFGYVFGVLRCH